MLRPKIKIFESFYPSGDQGWDQQSTFTHYCRYDSGTSVKWRWRKLCWVRRNSAGDEMAIVSSQLGTSAVAVLLENHRHYN